MKKTALHKNAWREIFNSKARFLSILGIIFLGVGFFSGIKATGPDMEKTADQYFAQQKLSDLTVQSSLGLTQADRTLLENNPDVAAVEENFSVDTVLSTTNQVARIFSLPEETDTLVVVSGHLPKNNGEIALDQNQAANFKIGDTFTVEEETLASQEYKIVGFVISPKYIEHMTRGVTTVGSGTIDFFGVITKDNFDQEIITSLSVRFKNLPTETYSTAYENQVAENISDVKKDFSDRPQERLTEIKDAANEEIANAQQDVTQGQDQLDQAGIDLEQAAAEIQSGRDQLAAGQAEFEEQITEAQAQLDENAAEIQQGQQELATAQGTLDETKATLDATSQELASAQENFQQQQTDWQQLKAQAETSITGLQTLQENFGPVNSQLTTILQLTDENQYAAQITALAGNLSTQLTNFPQLGLFNTANNLNGALENISANPSDRQNGTALQTALAQFLQEVDQTMTVTVQQVQDGDAQIADGLAQLEAAQAQLASGIAQYDDAVSQLAEKTQELADGQTQLDAGQAQLDEQIAQTNETFAETQAQLDEASTQYETGLAQYQEQLAENMPQLNDAQNEIQAEIDQLDSLEAADYFYFDRTNNQGYQEFSENATRITNIATVFPVLFFLIAALISFTTMTRMVEEKRGEIGTLKALGYSNGEISEKYLLYAGLSAVIGSILGIVVGNLLFPSMIFNAYGSLYNLPEIVIAWYPFDILIAFVVALLCTVVSALVALRVDLLNAPATLMRPKSPKAGKRLFIERLTFIWSRLSFIRKVTVRNLFRYKARAFMTIFGIAGCMSLMITGFGLRDSIGDIVNLQFGKLWHYQSVVTFNDEASAEDNTDYQEALDQLDGLNKTMPMSSTSFTKETKNVNQQEITVNVPEDPEQIADFISFNDRKTSKKYSLTDDGAIINEKLANLFDLEAGDTFTLKDADLNEYTIKVSAVTENYAMHFAYMTPTYYQEIFGQEPVYNSDYLLFDEALSSDDEENIAKDLMAKAKVLNVSFLSETSRAMDDTMSSLNIVVWVLIISAALLAFIVLYNLTNINISERIRELSTIKVLGFYNKEVTMYIYRENIVLTFFGIIFGCLLGIVVHRFVLQTVEVDMIMFGPNIHWLSFVYSSLLTIAFTLLVMFFMHQKLKKVDMIEALKSNE